MMNQFSFSFPFFVEMEESPSMTTGSIPARFMMAISSSCGKFEIFPSSGSNRIQRSQ